MPLSWIALYPQIAGLVEAEVARRQHLAEQASEVANKVAAAWLLPEEGQPAPPLTARDREIALLWLGAAVRAWEAVLECHSANSAAYQAGSQQRQRFQVALLTLLRQHG